MVAKLCAIDCAIIVAFVAGNSAANIGFAKSELEAISGTMTRCRAL
jgi:hypothetical protein